MEYAIVTENLSKTYKIYRQSIHRVFEALSFGKLKYHQDLRALEGINLSVEKGTALGVIGSNGAGKSTLLKILSNTSYPTGGSFQVDGKVSSLLELGAGFHFDFSGRDNIYLNGSVLGFTQEEINDRYNDIVQFSELGDFIEKPIRIYSSGMVMRLGFSVAVSMDPEVLIIDEILAVGDQHFQKKCIDKIHSFKNRGRTILFCSHSLYHVRQICDRVVWIKDGMVEMDGNPIEVTNEYANYERKLFREASRRDVREDSGQRRRGENLPFLKKAVLTLADSDEEVETVRTGDTVELKIHYEVPDPSVSFNLGVSVNRLDDIQCFGSSSLHEGVPVQKSGHAVFRINNLRLLAGEFTISVYIADENSMMALDQMIDVIEFKVEHDGYEVGIFRGDIEWIFEESKVEAL